MITTCGNDIEARTLPQITALCELMRKKRVQKVCVEAGHIYMNEEPGDQHRLGLGIGGMFCEVFRDFIPSISVTKMLFVDNYNPAVSTLRLHEYLELAKNIGFCPDVIVHEADLVGNAIALIGELSEAGATVIIPDGHTHTRQQNIRLRHANGRLSCCALDAALYIKRLQGYDFNVTVLPDNSECEYKKQQKNVRRLLRLAGNENLPLANIFFRQDGSFTTSRQ